MKNSRLRAKRVRRRKVAASAAYSRHFTVNNCTIPKSEVEWKTIPFSSTIQKYYKEKYPSIPSGEGIAYRLDDKGNVIFKDDSWKNPKEGYPQHKSMMKKHTEWIYDKEAHITKKVKVASTFQDSHYVEKFWWKNLPAAEKWEAYAQDKLKKWEKKHKKPCKDDDLFKEEFIPMWKEQRTKALERIRDFVVSVYDKLHIVGNRVDYKEGKMVEKTVAKVKDVDQKGHDVNHPNLKETDKLYKDATKAATIAMDKDPTIVDCDLKNHKGNQKRPLIHAKRDKPKNLKQQREYRKAA